MKKMIKPFVLSICLLATMTSGDIASAAASQIYLDSRPVVSTVEPRVINGYTMIQLRTIGNELGCDIKYDSPSKKITLTKSKTTVELWIGKTETHINGDFVFLETPPKIIDGYTMVPLRFIAQAFQCDVDYDAQTKNINITSKLPTDGENHMPGSSVEKNEETKKTDPWGNPIRTTNLPKTANMYPYIREDIPNWVYEQGALAWNNNIWGGQNNPKRTTYRKLLDSPAELWNDPDFGKNFWDKPHTTGKSGTVYTTKQVMDDFFKLHLNVDYRNITDAMKGPFINLAGEAVSPYSMADYTTQLVLNTAAGYQQYVKDSEVVISSDFKVLYEGVWRDYNGGDIIVHVPVLVTSTFEHIKGDTFFDLYGHYTITDGDLSMVRNIKTGDKFTAVVQYTMFKNPKDGRWQLWYGNMSQIRAMIPSSDLYDGVAPECQTKDKQTKFKYLWMKDDAPFITKYQNDYDLSKIKR